MRHLKSIQVLTDDSVFLLEKVMICLVSHDEAIPTELTKKIIVELGELIEELKSE